MPTVLVTALKASKEGNDMTNNKIIKKPEHRVRVFLLVAIFKDAVNIYLKVIQNGGTANQAQHNCIRQCHRNHLHIRQPDDWRECRG